MLYQHIYKKEITTMARTIEPHPAGKFYGTPATSMSGREFQKKFGSANTRSGAIGEQKLFEVLRGRNGWLPAHIPLFCSLHTPGADSADIDFAVVNGNKILLIDAKFWRQNTGFVWNLGDDGENLFEGIRRWKSKNGTNYKFSRSMIMAKKNIKKALPGFQVESIVIMVTDHKYKNTRLPNTRFLTAPGGVKVLNMKTAKKYIAKYFKGTERTTDTYNAEIFLEKYTQ